MEIWALHLSCSFDIERKNSFIQNYHVIYHVNSLYDLENLPYGTRFLKLQGKIQTM